jgi:lipid II:glycine glycyltransferase (peptidoglycan interpeptide bridge formation enzyme)
MNAKLASPRPEPSLSSAEGPAAVSFSRLRDDPTWDQFVSTAPGGHHVQTSWWAEAKAFLGWHAARVMVARDGQIQAGAQVIYKPIRLFGAVGYVSRGPLTTANDPAVRELLLDGLDRLCREERIGYLLVQPPPEGERLIQCLRRRGFRPGFVDLEPSPSWTTVVDLAPDLPAILARMKDKTRYNIRLAERKGLTSREATEADLGHVYRLLAATSARQEIPLPAEGYFHRLWVGLHARGHLKIFLTEYEGEPLSAIVLVAFRDTVTFKYGGWSGQHGKLHPNEAMHWSAIRWAKANGYRYYDFESLDPRVGQAARSGEPLADPQARTVTTFKLGFGGEVRCLPGSYERMANPALRQVYNPLSTLVMGSPALRASIKRLSKVVRAR